MPEKGWLRIYIFLYIFAINKTMTPRSTRVTVRKHPNLISKCKFDGFKKKKMFKKLARLR